MKLAHRIALLVSIPFALLIVLLIVILWLQVLNRAQVSATRRSSSQLQLTAQLVQSIGDAERGARGYLLTANPQFAQPYNRAKSSVPTTIAALRDSFSGDDDLEQRKRAEHIIALARAKMAALDNQVTLARNGKRDTAIALVRGQAGMRLMDRLMKTSATFELEESAERRKSHQTLDRMWQAFDYLLIFGTLAAAALTILINLILNRKIVERVSRLAGNIERFARGEPLAPQGPGSDEISELDRSFHEMARLINERARLERYKLLLERARDIIYFCRRSDGRIVEANAAATEAYGYAREEFLTRTIYDLRTTDTHSSIPALMRHAAEETVYFETVHRRKDGTTFPVEVTSQGAEIDGEDMLLSIVRDVSQRRHAEELTQIALARTVEISRLKSEFVATMSHELRTPMNAVLGITELLLDSPLAPQQREYVGLVRSSGEALLRIVDDMIDYSTLEAGELTSTPEDFDLSDQLQRVAGEFASQAAEKRLAFAVHVDDAIPAALHGDAHRLRQALAQLLDNAIKFTNAGSVALEAALAADQGASVAVSFTVRDTGIGIDPANREALFEPFRQGEGSAAREHGGAGVGLTLAKRVVELLGGTLEAEGAPGSGSAFWFVLRFARAAKPDPEAASSLSSILRSERILVVDDNEINLRLASAQLQRLGFPSETVNNGADGVEAALGGRFAAVLMDCQMPGMDGYQAARTIRARETDRHVPIIAMTANALASDRAACFAAGMDDYLSKPVRLDALGAALEKALAVAPALDTARLTELFGDDPQTIAAVLEMAQRSFGRDLERLYPLLEAGGDTAQAAALIHELKGAAGNVGAVDLARIAVDMEAAVRAHARLDVPALRRRLELALERFEVAARNAAQPRITEPVP